MAPLDIIDTSLEMSTHNCICRASSTTTTCEKIELALQILIRTTTYPSYEYALHRGIFPYNLAMEVTVIIPVYNEKDNINEVIDLVKSVGIAQEIIVVDDFSNDGTRELLKTKKSVKTVFHAENRGKGAAIRSGLKNATGEIIIIQDADLEYSPQQYPQLIKPIKEKRANVVYGSRILGKGHFLKSSYYANRFLTLMTNVLFNAHISDMETCYKVVKTELFRDLQLISSRFEIEPEITCKILKRGEQIIEIPITYTGRKKGKKIGVKDGIQAIWNLIKWKFKK